MRILCLIGVIALATIFNLPYHNYQDFLSQGDHGRDLYAASAVLRGEVPYKDFWWVYGPLMPYYYGAFFKFLGTQITSILLGKIILNVLSGAFLFLALSEIIPLSLACIGALWFIFFHQDFFFTYNHAGGITLITAAVWMHLRYLKTSRLSCAWGALIIVFFLGLIKINFAITALIMTLAIVAITNRSFPRTPIKTFGGDKLFYTAAFLFIPLAWFGVYASLLNGLSLTEIRQCLPYLGGDEPYNHLSPLETVPMLIKTILAGITTNWINIGFGLFVTLCTTLTIVQLFFQPMDKSRRNLILIVIAYALLFYIFNLHEFLKSGVFYRYFWAQPLSNVLMFTMIATALSAWPKLSRQISYAALLAVLGFGCYTNTKAINSMKNPNNYFGSPKAKIYFRNDRQWVQAVVLTTRQISTALKPDESFLALPYDCLYYYLTDRKSPTRQLIFFDHINISSEQEQSVIRELQDNHVAVVVVSSRQSSKETGLGTLGVSYCPLLTEYINSNFAPIAKIGDWVNEPGWAWNHGTLVLRKK